MSSPVNHGVNHADYGDIFAGLGDLDAGRLEMPAPTPSTPVILHDMEGPSIPLSVPQLALWEDIPPPVPDQPGVIVGAPLPVLAEVVQPVMMLAPLPVLAEVVQPVMMLAPLPVLAQQVIIVTMPVQTQQAAVVVPAPAKVISKKHDRATYDRVTRLSKKASGSSEGETKKRKTRQVSPEEKAEKDANKRARDRASRHAREFKAKNQPEALAREAAEKEAQRLRDIGLMKGYDQWKTNKNEAIRKRKAAEKERQDQEAKERLRARLSERTAGRIQEQSAVAVAHYLAQPAQPTAADV
jgi:hypothetical protein